MSAADLLCSRKEDEPAVCGWRRKEEGNAVDGWRGRVGRQWAGRRKLYKEVGGWRKVYEAAGRLRRKEDEEAVEGG